MPTHNRPIAVDLDGTLIHTDLLHESALALLKLKPYFIFVLPFWALQGKAVLKQKIAQQVVLNIASLPFNHELIDWLKVQKGLGRKLILCTASDQSLALEIANHLAIFDEVLASQNGHNLSGKNKAALLVERFGEKQFDYAGNANIDVIVWQSAHSAIVVSNSAALEQKARTSAELACVIKRPKATIKTLARALRVHQWIKNLLIFIPLLAAHQAGYLPAWSLLVLAFIAFSICASAIYIINDLFDLESDRLHIRKRFRPFAAGDLPVVLGCLLIPVLLALSFGLAWHVGTQFFAWLLVYCGLTCAYSWRIKQLVLVDCLTLAILYTLRIVAGAAAVSVPLSFWLLAFSIFLFLSLAFIKRYAELEIQQLNGISKVHGRGYYTSDASLIQQLGVTSGYTAVLVLALYLNSENVVRLYQTPQIIWAAIPLMLLWLSWMWLKAHRGLMHDDPIVFAIKDKTSLLIGLLFITTFILASWWT